MQPGKFAVELWCETRIFFVIIISMCSRGCAKFPVHLLSIYEAGPESIQLKTF